MNSLNLSNDISVAIATLPPDRALCYLIEKAVKNLEIDSVNILTQHEKSNQMAAYVVCNQETEISRFKSTEFFLQECFKYYLGYHEASQIPSLTLSELEISHSEYRFYGCPLVYVGKPVAMCVLAQKRIAGEMSPEIKQRIEGLIPIMGILFENLRLENEVLHKNSRLSALYEISQQTESAIDFRNVYSALSKVAQSFISFDAYQIYLISADGDALEAKSNTSNTEAFPRAIPLDEGPIWQAVKKCQPQLAYIGEFNSVLILPMEVSGKVVGVFVIGSRKAYAYRDEDVIGLQIIATHIASIDVMFKDLLSLKGFTERILDSMNSGVLIFDREGRVSYANTEIKLMMRMNFPELPEGWSPFSSHEKMPLELNELLTYALKNHLSLENKRLRLRLPDGCIKHIEVNAFPFRSAETGAVQGTACFIKDITQIIEMEEQLRRADKLSAIGMLAAGIAHEIRNPLTGMKMITQLLESEYEDDDERKEPLSIIQKEINRLEGIVGNLLDFAKPSKVRFVGVSVEKVLKDCHALIQNQLKNQSIRYALKCELPLPLVQGDSDQLKQVFINIMTNAIQAQKQGGFLSITIYIQNEYLLVEFKDSGMGIDYNKVNSIFNPFMTTKKEGTGLGLSMAQRIMEKHGGRIEVLSEPNEGSTFIVYLPLSFTDKKDMAHEQ